jgi:V/A-type H+/Na+-transporting ATPase subunit K
LTLGAIDAWEDSSMKELISLYFLSSGIGWAMLGAAAGLMLGCIGSARGIRIAAGQAAGVMSEKPELFGKLLPLMAMPGTQGIYGLLWMIIVAMRTGLFGKEPATATPLVGVVLMLLGIAVGGALLKSAVLQGETSAAAINLTSRRPDQSGRAIILPALVEFYALVALVAGIMIAFMVSPAKLGEAKAEAAAKKPAVTATENPGDNK